MCPNSWRRIWKISELELDIWMSNLMQEFDSQNKLSYLVFISNIWLKSSLTFQDPLKEKSNGAVGFYMNALLLVF